MMKLGTSLSALSLLWILTASIVVPVVQSDPETYGPRLDELVGRYIESPAAQRYAMYSGDVDLWPDIRDLQIIRGLEYDGYTVVYTPEAFLYYRIDFNVRDQWGNGTHVECALNTWSELPRGPTPRDSSYYTYHEAPYMGYVPLDDESFRHAIAHLIPKDEIVAVVYGDFADGINSTVPPAQEAWHNPNVDGHPYNPAEAVAILEAAGYVFNPTAPNPAPKHSPTDPDGNWLDPHLQAATNDPGTPWDDTERMPMNHITFAGVTEPLSPDSYGRDDLCVRDMRAIGLPIEHVEIDYGYLTDTMMDYYQFDMYALGWHVSRFPDHLYGFFHSSNNFAPEGCNIPGVEDPELDAMLETIQHGLIEDEVRLAAFAAQSWLAEHCVCIPTVTRPLTVAAATLWAPGGTDTLTGIVESSGYGSTNDWTFYDLHWESMVDPVTNPYGVGGTARYIVPSEPTNYHPGYASTTDEWLVLSRLFDPLIHVDPYTHDDIPWLATDWTVEPWTAPGDLPGMNTTFWLRDDIYWHDGVHYTADSAKWSLEFACDQQIARALPMWQHLVDIEVWSDYCFSVYHNATSLWTFYQLAGPDVWLVNDAACWATMFPQHIYEGTDQYFRPEATPHPTVDELTCLIGTGPYVFREADMTLGGYVRLTAYRPGPSPVTTHWWMSVEAEDALLTELFHPLGDTNRDGLIDIFDLVALGLAWESKVGDPHYNPDADLNEDGYVDICDLCVGPTMHWNWQRKYPTVGGGGGMGDPSSQSTAKDEGASPPSTVESQELADATMYVDPPEISNMTLKAGDLFSVDINITDVADLLGFHFKLTFNSTILNVTSITPGDFFGADPFVFNKVIDNVGGFVQLVLTPKLKTKEEGGTKSGVSGSGRLATIDFQVKGYGNSSLTQKGFTKLSNSKGIRVVHLSLDGYFDNRNPCDITADGVVDIFDLSIACKAYGRRIGEPGYDPRADINQDGVVEIRDIAAICKEWGWTW